MPLRLAAVCSRERLRDARAIGARAAISRDSDPLVRQVAEWARHRIAQNVARSTGPCSAFCSMTSRGFRAVGSSARIARRMCQNASASQ